MQFINYEPIKLVLNKELLETFIEKISNNEISLNKNSLNFKKKFIKIIIYGKYLKPKSSSTLSSGVDSNLINLASKI